MAQTSLAVFTNIPLLTEGTGEHIPYTALKDSIIYVEGATLANDSEVCFLSLYSVKKFPLFTTHEAMMQFSLTYHF
jgi:hypothetical protein